MKTYVYCAPIPFVTDGKIYPQQRAAEISAARDLRVRDEKLYVWKLLEFAIRDVFGANMEDINFEKCGGKWTVADHSGIFFSLSHTADAVAVAVSDAPCGVDIEKYCPERFGSRLAKRIMCEEEYNLYCSLDEKGKMCLTAHLWTKKESIFKMLGREIFVPKDVNTFKYTAETVYFGDEKNIYVLSSSAENDEGIVFCTYGKTEYTIREK